MAIATLSIVSHGHGRLVESLLRDLAQQDGIDAFNVVLTLNLPGERFDPASGEGLRLVVRRNDVPQGFARNHNRALHGAEGDWFVVVNPDIRISDRHALLRLLSGNSDAVTAALRAPVILNPAGEVEDSVRQNLTPWSLLKRSLGLGDDPVVVTGPSRWDRPFYWLAGMFMVIESKVFAAIGGFDERFFLYCEDYDLCARLYRAGYSLALDQSTHVVHDAQRASHRSMRHLTWHLGSLLRVWFSRPFWGVTLLPRRARRGSTGG